MRICRNIVHVQCVCFSRFLIAKDCAGCGLERAIWRVGALGPPQCTSSLVDPDSAQEMAHNALL
eukprot:2556136-Alexandrium_andersonii.AAC.1